jgi:CBS domain-containing protein
MLISDGADAALERTLRQRYVEGYRITVVAPDADAVTTLRPLREQGEQLALLIFEQPMVTPNATIFLELSRALYPDVRKVRLADDADNPDKFDYAIPQAWMPAETKLYPVVDELLADWRASVDMPFMRAKGIMTVRTVSIRLGDSLHRAAELIALSGIGDLMVIDDHNDFVGVLSVGDVLRAAMPDIEEIMGEGGTLEQAFRLFMRKGSELRYKPIEPLVISNPLVVDPDDHVAKVAALMLEKNIHRLPVVKDGRLLGTVGRADICQAVVGTL